MKLLSSLIIAMLLAFSGCNNPPKPAIAPAKSINERPAWIYGSGAVGMCGTHMKGTAAQEQVAMDRALEKLAKQQTVSVKSSSVSSQKEAAGRYSSSFNSNSTIDANAKVKGHIKATWRNPRNNSYYVWMVAD